MDFEFQWDEDKASSDLRKHRVGYEEAVRQKGNDVTMKKNPATKPKPQDDLLPEYRFDYKKAKPNRFASRLKSGVRVVILDPDVASVFSTPESVNAVLRALIATMPDTARTNGKS